MGKFRSLSMMGQIALGGSVLYLIFSFLKWQEACVGGGGVNICVSRNEWHGWGVLAVLAAIGIIAYEGAMLWGMKLDVRGLPPALVSGILALVLVLATVLKFFADNEFRKFWATIQLILAIVIAGASWMRMKEQGVDIPRPGSSPPPSS
jgi:hypothetical protein